MNEEKPSQKNSLNELELKVLEYWDQEKMFERSLKEREGQPPFIFYDGPPFATGMPHYGSLLSSIIKDAVGRYQTMRGHYVRRRWGWDCHGLPIENMVEQNLKISGKKQIEEIGVDRFNKVCRDNVLQYAAEWGKVIKRTARWVEFENSYKTMDTSYMESVWWALKQIWDKGLVYEDRKVLLYCSRCETPISNFEVAMDNSYKDVTERSVFVKFKLAPKQRIVDFITDDATFALAWTTTPWTLPGNTSLNIGPDITYVLIEQDGQNLILAKDRLEILEGEYEIKSELAARSLEGLSYEPLYSSMAEALIKQAKPGEAEKLHKIYAADFVTTEDGTGIVHNAAMYGEEDYQLAKQVGLPRVDMLDHTGRYMDYAPENLRGQFFKDADKIIIDELSKAGSIYKILDYTHSYPHCYRCSTPLFYNALPAWFINIQKIKPRLLELNQGINWYPGHLKDGRFGKSVEAAPDWNISRNRYWATALPFWKCQNPECKDVVCVGSIADLQEKSTNFAEVYPNHDPANIEATDLHKPYIDQVKLKCEKCGGEMLRVPEVVDCWVESGSMPFAELHYPFDNQELFKQRFPADFVAEYINQTRAWFYVMHVMSTLLFDEIPFKNVVTTGVVQAEDGQKMSKSKKNYPDPWKLMEQYGADAMRFYLLASPVMQADDLNFSEKSVAEVSRKISGLLLNVLSFYRLYESGTKVIARPEVAHVLDAWMLAKFDQTHQDVTKFMDGYNTVKAGKALLEFINELSTWYVRRSRDRMKEGDTVALSTLGYVLAETAKMLAPLMPFLAEHVYRDITGDTSVHLVIWTESRSPEEKLLTQMELVQKLVEMGLSLRKDNNLKVRQALSEFIYVLPEGASIDSELEKILSEELNVQQVKNAGEIIPRAQVVTRTDNNIQVALNTEINEELRRDGLARELERLVQDFRKKSGLKVGQLVDLYYNTQDADLEDILLNLVNRKKTFVNQIAKHLEVEADFETQGEIEKIPIWLGLVKI